MGLGTRIKDALHGDRDPLGSKRRKAPGAYPESSVDIPRTNTTASWKTANTNQNGATREAKADSISEEEYTHTPIDAKAHRDVVSPIQKEPDEGLFSSADTKTGNTRPEVTEKTNKQHPYWGDVGRAKAKELGGADDKFVDNSDADSGIAAVGKHLNDSFEGLEVHHPKPVGANYGTYVNEITRNNTIPNTHPALRDTTDNANEHKNGLNLPTNSVNRGRVMLVDDDAAKATSMAASQVSTQPTEYAGDYGTTAPAYENTGYSNGYGTVHGPTDMNYNANTGLQRSDTIGRGNNKDVRGTFGVTPPHHSDPYSPEQAPAQHLAKTGTGLSEQYYSRPEDAAHRDFAQTMGFQGRGQAGYNNNSSSNAQNGGVVVLPGQTSSQMERSSPAHSSEQGSGSSSAKPLGGEHYGPGHAGARVLHRCAHCGHDNDITKYFSKDVVYRLS